MSSFTAIPRPAELPDAPHTGVTYHFWDKDHVILESGYVPFDTEMVMPENAAGAMYGYPEIVPEGLGFRRDVWVEYTILPPENVTKEEDI